jgi:hypothetical protein
VRLLIALVVWVAAVAAAVAVSSTVAGSIHKTAAGPAGTISGSSSGGSSSDGSAGPDPSAIKSTDRISLFHITNLQRVLGKARADLGADAQIDNFVIYPGYLSLTAVKGTGEVDLYADANGRLIQTSGGSPGSTSLFRLSQISPAVPAALTQRIATAAHVPESQLHYIVVDVDPESSHKLEWLIYGVQGSPVEYFKASGATGPLLEYRSNSSTGPQPVKGA